MAMPDLEKFINSKMISGKRYTINALGGWAAWKGWTLIQKTVAPVMGELVDSRNVDQDVALFEKQNTFSSILTIVAENIDKPEMDKLIIQMLDGATVDGVALDIDVQFKGCPHDMFELVVFALEVNFKGFFTKSDMFQSMMGGLNKIMGGTEEE